MVRGAALWARMGNSQARGWRGGGAGAGAAPVVVSKKGKFIKCSAGVVEQKLAHAAKLGTLR